jgi:hypothetical protein
MRQHARLRLTAAAAAALFLPVSMLAPMFKLVRRRLTTAAGLSVAR